jgi:hypothetical protein
VLKHFLPVPFSLQRVTGPAIRQVRVKKFFSAIFFTFFKTIS